METARVFSEEKLREFCCIGNEEKVKLLLDQGVNVNSSNKINGWTPIHWASKRGHKKIVETLLSYGAKSDIETNKGEGAAQLTKDPDIQQLLCGNVRVQPLGNTQLPIVPNYLRHPKFIYADEPMIDSFPPEHLVESPRSHHPQDIHKANGDFPRHTGKPLSPGLSPDKTKQHHCRHGSRAFFPPPEELVLKVRIEKEQDFIEIEMDFDHLTYENLLNVCCLELSVELKRVDKIRKLPNTIVRKDKDVARLQQFQELELVLGNAE